MLLLLFLSSCSISVKNKIAKSYSTINYKEDIRVVGIDEIVTQNYEELGIVKIEDDDILRNYGLEVALNKAQLEARKVGGNAIQIIDLQPPKLFANSSYLITFKIFRINGIPDSLKINIPESSILNADYALLHIYRFDRAGGTIKYNLQLGDSTICKVKSNWKETIKVKKEGLNTIWSKTEARTDLSIKIENGREYYIRCGSSLGFFAWHPYIEIVDNAIGRIEYESIKVK